MPPEVVVAIIFIIGTVVTTLVNWGLNKKVGKVNKDTNYVEGANLAVDSMMDSIAELRQKCHELNDELVLLRAQNKDLRDEITLLRLQLASYRKEIS